MTNRLSDEALNRTVRWFAVALRCGSVPGVAIPGLIGHTPEVDDGTLGLVLAGLALWATVFTVVTVTRRPTGALVIADSAVIGAVLLVQDRVVPAAAIADGSTWSLMLASTGVFVAQFCLRPPLGLPLGGLIAVVYALTATAAGSLVLLVQALAAGGMMYLLHTAGHDADAEAERTAEVARRQAVQAARRETESADHRRLHDTVLSTLTMVGAGMVTAPALVRAYAARDLLMLEELRRPATGPPTAPSTAAVRLDLGLSRAVEGAPLQVDFEAPPTTVPAATAEAIEGCVFEALINTTRHAGVESAVVRVVGEPGRIRVEVTDRGRGFDPAAVPPTRRGIRSSIIARAEESGGAVEVDSAPGAGTRIRMWWPRGTGDGPETGLAAVTHMDRQG